MQLIGGGWRVGEPNYDNELTAADVVEYEQDELGNDIGVDPMLLPFLRKLDAAALWWVCPLEEDAKRYETNDDGDVLGEASYEKFRLPALVIGNDGGDGGLLVLRLEYCVIW